MHYNDYIMSAHQYGDNYTLTMMEVHTLSYIEDHPGTSSGELIQYWDKTKGTISQILTKLEKLELIEKSKKDGNAKNLYLYVTAEGSRVSKAHKMYDILDIAKTMSQLQKQCSAEEIEAFYHVISVYNEVIKKDFEINKSPRKRTDVTPLPDFLYAKFIKRNVPWHKKRRNPSFRTGSCVSFIHFILFCILYYFIHFCSSMIAY